MHKYVHEKYSLLLFLYVNTYIFVLCNVQHVFFFSFNKKKFKTGFNVFRIFTNISIYINLYEAENSCVRLHQYVQIYKLEVRDSHQRNNDSLVITK